MGPLLKPPVGPGDHVIGTADAVIEIVEYGDFQCPHCAAAHPVTKEILKVFGNQVRFVFRNFPLAESHRYATIAAIAAEAAGLQHKYWEMHDMIFEHQASLSYDSLFELADKLGLNRRQFERDLQNEALSDKVESDFESGIRSGVNGTPSFFVNGNKFDGAAGDLFAMLKESSY